MFERLYRWLVIAFCKPCSNSMSSIPIFDMVPGHLAKLHDLPLSVRPRVIKLEGFKKVDADETLYEWLARLTKFDAKTLRAYSNKRTSCNDMNALKWRYDHLAYEATKLEPDDVERKLSIILKAPTHIVDVVPWACPYCGMIIDMRSVVIEQHLKDEHLVQAQKHDVERWAQLCWDRLPDWSCSDGRSFDGSRVWPPIPPNYGAFGMGKR